MEGQVLCVYVCLSLLIGGIVQPRRQLLVFIP